MSSAALSKWASLAVFIVVIYFVKQRLLIDFFAHSLCLVLVFVVIRYCSVGFLKR